MAAHAAVRTRDTARQDRPSRRSADLSGYKGGHGPEEAESGEEGVVLRLAIQCAARGLPIPEHVIGNEPYVRLLAQNLRENGLETAAADARLQGLLSRAAETIDYPLSRLILPRRGENLVVPAGTDMGAVLSFPKGGDFFQSPYLTSYKLHRRQGGVLHNPDKDVRTTEGTFHIAIFGPAIPGDKKEVPLRAALGIIERALRPPDELLTIPYTTGAGWRKPLRLFCSTYLKPIVAPAAPEAVRQSAPATLGEQFHEVRIFSPGAMVASLDFAGRIFPSGGNPYLHSDDALFGNWAGTSGAIIVAPHLAGRITKMELGLPHVDARGVTDRMRHDGMCWSSPGELYNDGRPFKLTLRDGEGRVVTVIADSYFGYVKKEVKTQLSYAANLLGGGVSEAHTGATLAHPRVLLGNAAKISGVYVPADDQGGMRRVRRVLGSEVTVDPASGAATDRHFPKIRYVPWGTEVSIHPEHGSKVSWSYRGKRQERAFDFEGVLIYPDGSRVHAERGKRTDEWHLIRTWPRGTLIERVAVSGGGKSELSKPLSNAVTVESLRVSDPEAAFATVREVLARDYSARFREPPKRTDRRTFLDERRSLGSVVKLLTPSEGYTEEHNRWLRSIELPVRQLALACKYLYDPARHATIDDLVREFTTASAAGMSGHQVFFNERALRMRYVRVGGEGREERRLPLRFDFVHADKLALGDDITAERGISIEQEGRLVRVKVIENCEQRFFQRPDEARIPRADEATEGDLSDPAKPRFVVNHEPLRVLDSRRPTGNLAWIDQFSSAHSALLRDIDSAAAKGEDGYFVCSATHRVVNGKPSKNPRYLQDNPGLDPFARRLQTVTNALHSGSVSPIGETPTAVTLIGARVNPADPQTGMPNLAVFNPLHYLPPAERFMEFISSISGKSPSTSDPKSFSGPPSEGVNTKGPFNMLIPAADINATFIDHILTQRPVYLAPTGYIGPKHDVAHDIGNLMADLLCRLSSEELRPAYWIKRGFLARVQDFDHNGGRVPASRLGYRLTRSGMEHFFGRIVAFPETIFSEEMLKPELQDRQAYAQGIIARAASQRRVAEQLINDGTYQQLVPPLQVLVRIMRDGHAAGRGLDDPAVQRLFTPRNVLGSAWFRARAEAFTKNETARLGAMEELLLERMRAMNELPRGFDITGLRALAGRRLRELRLSRRALEQRPGRSAAALSGLGSEIGLQVRPL